MATFLQASTSVSPGQTDLISKSIPTPPVSPDGPDTCISKSIPPLFTLTVFEDTSSVGYPVLGIRAISADRDISMTLPRKLGESMEKYVHRFCEHYNNLSAETDEGLFASGVLPYMDTAQILAANFPPAKRLVGIETNPGPKSPLLLLPAAASAIIGAVKSSLKSTKKKIPKKKKSNNTNRRRLQTIPILPTSIVGRRTSQTAPQAISNGLSSRVPSVSLRVPFRNTVLLAVTNASGNAQFVSIGNGSNQYFAMDLMVRSNSNVSTPKGMFGNAIRTISEGFSRWRLSDLTVIYNGICSVTTVGSVAIGYDNDPAGGSAVNDFTATTCLSDNINGSPWANSSTMTLPIRSLDRTWKYTAEAGSPPLSAEQRLCCPGCLYIASVGTANSTNLGTVTLSGTLEFADLIDDSAYTTLAPIQPSLLVNPPNQNELAGVRPSYCLIRFGLDGTPCTAAAPLGSGNPQILEGNYPPYFASTPTSLTTTTADNHVTDVYCEWTGLTNAAAPTITTGGGGSAPTSSSSTSTTYATSTFKFVTTGVSSISFTGLTSLTDGTVLILLRTIS